MCRLVDEPLLQLGLVPLFDADPVTFNISLFEAACVAHHLRRASALVAVHVLGNSAEMGPLLEIVRRHKLILVEDTCESLGSRAVLAPAGAGGGGGAMLGTFGAFGSFSFYFSHHITSGEGGMIVCQTEADLNSAPPARARLDAAPDEPRRGRGGAAPGH